MSSDSTLIDSPARQRALLLDAAKVWIKQAQGGRGSVSLGALDAYLPPALRPPGLTSLDSLAAAAGFTLVAMPGAPASEMLVMGPPGAPAAPPLITLPGVAAAVAGNALPASKGGAAAASRLPPPEPTFESVKARATALLRKHGGSMALSEIGLAVPTATRPANTPLKELILECGFVITITDRSHAMVHLSEEHAAAFKKAAAAEAAGGAAQAPAAHAPVPAPHADGRLTLAEATAFIEERLKRSGGSINSSSLGMALKKERYPVGFTVLAHLVTACGFETDGGRPEFVVRRPHPRA